MPTPSVSINLYPNQPAPRVLKVSISGDIASSIWVTCAAIIIGINKIRNINAPMKTFTFSGSIEMV